MMKVDQPDIKQKLADLERRLDAQKKTSFEPDKRISVSDVDFYNRPLNLIYGAGGFVDSNNDWKLYDNINVSTDIGTSYIHYRFDEATALPVFGMVFSKLARSDLGQYDFTFDGVGNCTGACPGLTLQLTNLNLSTLTGGNIFNSSSVVTSMLQLDDSQYGEDNTGFGAWTSGVDASTYTITGGKFQIDRSGYGYIRGKKISWSAGIQSAVLAANVCSFIFIAPAGMIIVKTTPTDADFFNYICMFEVLYDGTNYTVCRENHPMDFQTSINRYLHDAVGIVIEGAGGVVTRVATGTGASADDRRIKIVGSDVLSDHGLETTISALSPVTWDIYYTNAAGKWIRYSQASELPSVYNNAGTVSALTANNRGIYTLYVTKDDIETSTPKYIAVMDMVDYANLAAAQAALTNGTSVRATNELAYLECAQLGYAIVKNSGGGFVEVLTVAKSTYNSKIIGSGAIGAHSLLSGLLNDDHTQYLLANCSRAGTGNLTSVSFQTAARTIVAGVQAQMEMGYSNPYTSLLVNVASSNINYAPGLEMYRSQGTIVSPTDIAASHCLGAISIRGYLNGEFRQTSNILFYCDAVSGSTVTSHMDFGSGDNSASVFRWSKFGLDLVTQNLLFGPTIGTSDITVKRLAASSLGIYSVGHASASQLFIEDTTALGANNGGGITFGGIYTAGGSDQYSGKIKTLKLNATTGDYAYDMAFYTMPNGGALTERMRLKNDGKVCIGTTTATYDLNVIGVPCFGSAIGSNSGLPCQAVVNYGPDGKWVEELNYDTNYDMSHRFFRSRGSFASPADCATNDGIFSRYGLAWKNGAYRYAMFEYVDISGVGASSVDGRYSLSLSISGSWVTKIFADSSGVKVDKIAAGGTSYWTLGAYTTTAPAATGYVTITIGGTTYKLLAST